MDGLLILNKPINCSSMDVIRRIRKLTGIKKVGHAGTLDPLATGVLLVCIGKSTKKISTLMDLKKEYITKIDLHAFSTTQDAEGELTSVEINKIPTYEEIEQILNSKFIGNISQIPPKFSALKINGVRAYKKAANGEDFEINARNITIYSIEIISYNWPLLEIKVNCSKGTYIRSLAQDIGKELKTGGYIIELIRTAIGNYTLEQTLDLIKTQTIKESDIVKI
jgi:tRNA pseudouridine55 synthase